VSGGKQNSNRVVQSLGIMFGLLLLIPLILMSGKILRAYSGLQDVQFQGEKLLHQQQVLKQGLDMQQKYLATIQSGFKPLNGNPAQANAALQTHLRKLIVSVGGNVETSSSVNVKADASTTMRTVAINVRWSVSEEGFAKFLANNSVMGQNLKIDSLLIRRRQGTASLLDIRMQCSALWQDGSKDIQKAEK